MKLVTFEPLAAASQDPAQRHRRARHGALLADGRVLDLQHAACGVPPPPDPLGWYDLDGATLRAVAAHLGDPTRLARASAGGAALETNAVRLGPPVPKPSKVICIGLNYRDHAIESGMAIPERPLVFSKFPSCVIGPEDTIQLPLDSQQVDYEAELGVVIGRRVSRCTRAEAAAAVLGYMNLNDVSARDFQFADGQWQRGKACDTFCPTGPFLATTDEVSDPHTLRIRCRVDGVTLQDSTTAQLIFGVPELVTYLARTITLEPGDLIATGTPPGVGFARKPPVWLHSGNRVEIEIEGLGVLANPVG
jgi:2-keto-4-pentenoate hydratase/2-oxohepta-3-ene-1,7-dioic acid hydratase in catechol pathway